MWNVGTPLAVQWWGLCTSTAGGQVHLCPGTKIPAAAKKKKKNQRRTPLLKSARSQVLIPMCKTLYDLSLSLSHTRTHTHIPLQSYLTPHPTPGHCVIWFISQFLCTSLVGMPFPLTNLPGKTWSISQVPGHLHLLCRTFQAEVIHSCFVFIEAHIFSSSCLSLYSLLDVSSLYS